MNECQNEAHRGPGPDINESEMEFTVNAKDRFVLVVSFERNRRRPVTDILIGAQQIWDV